jgi:hypothetical protein
MIAQDMFKISINMNINDKITGNFDDYVITHPMYMHEYGHTIDSRNWGPVYLYGVGIPSLNSVSKNKLIVKQDAQGNDLNPYQLWTHDVFWTEMRANRLAKKYFQYYGFDWEKDVYPKGYPTRNPF